MLDGTYSNQEAADRTGDLMYGKLVELSIYNLDQFEVSIVPPSGLSKWTILVAKALNGDS